MNTDSFYQGMYAELNKRAQSTEVAAAGASKPQPQAAPRTSPAPNINPHGGSGGIAPPTAVQRPANTQPQAQQQTDGQPVNIQPNQRQQAFTPRRQHGDGTPIDNPRGFFRSRQNLPPEQTQNTGYAEQLDSNAINWNPLNGQPWMAKSQDIAKGKIDAAMKGYNETGNFDTGGMSPEELNTLRYSEWAKNYVLDKGQETLHNKITDPGVSLSDLSGMRPQDPKSMAGKVYSDMAEDPTRRGQINEDLSGRAYGLASIDEKGGTKINPGNFQGGQFLKDHWGKLLAALLGIGAMGWMGNQGGQQQQPIIINNNTGGGTGNMQPRQSALPSYDE